MDELINVRFKIFKNSHIEIKENWCIRAKKLVH